MSVNITVNGKFVSKHCPKNSLLFDREKAKKDLEEERRKKRLLQVREQSKKIAEKIRNDVKESKRKGLEKYEATKTEEFEAWRQQALLQNKKECCEAIFQVGTAHKAAKKENKAQAEKQAAKQGTYKEFRRQMAARRSNKENFPKQGPGPCICSKVHICPNTQFECKCYQAGKDAGEPHNKRKRDSCFSSSDSETANSDEEISNEETLKDTSSITSMSPYKSATTTTVSNNIATQTSLICPEKNLRKTPAVYLDVEVGSDDSVLITAPIEIKDRHAECNRQFSSVIRVSPRKGAKQRMAAKSDNSKSQVTSVSTTTSNSNTEYRQNSQNISKSEQNPVNPKEVTKEKRFTMISDLVKKQQEQTKPVKETSPAKRRNTETNLNSSPRKFVAMPASIEPFTRPPVSRPLSQPPITPPMSPPKASISSKSSKVVNGGHKQPTSNSAASTNTVAMGSTSSSSCRVQFYDYNSKLTKESAQTQTNVMVNRQRDSVQPTAMEQATMENRLLYDRQQDVLNKNKQMEERGQKALEREQIRRDCNDLTEKLEALTGQYPRQVPTNENPHIFVDKQLRMEGKMNSAVEKLLNRPNIITCSEVEQSDINADRKRQQTVNAANKPFNEINVGASSNNILPDDDATSDSCCSILLGYVDDQTRQVRKDLEQWSDIEENGQKQKRLRNLLQRLDELRKSLLQELKTDQKGSNKGEKVKASSSSNKDRQYRQLIEDITIFRQERENIMVDDINHQQKARGKDKIPPIKEVRESKNEKSSNKKQNDKNPLDEREKLLQQKEAVLEEKVREFYELQKQQKKPHKLEKGKDSASETPTESQEIEESDYSDNKENINCSAMQTPVEIVITVQGETKCIKIPAKQQNKRKPVQKKPPTQLATLIRSPQPKGPIKKATPKKKIPLSGREMLTARPKAKTSIESKENPAAKVVLGRHNSYDSNSTSYMSLPPQMPTQLGALVDKNVQQQTLHNSSTEDTQTSMELDNDESQGHNFKKPVPHLNPLVAQYVQRLLGMSRKAVQRLGVSSSDIDTPSSTLINTSGNNSTSESTILSDERLACVESFVQENRSFIKELEQSLRAQNNTSLENSMRTFDEIWRKQLKKQHKTASQKSREKLSKQQQSEKKSNIKVSKESVTKQRSETKELQSKEVTSQTKLTLDWEKPPSTSKPTATTQPTKYSKVQEKPKEFESSPEIVTQIKAKQKSFDNRRTSDKVDKAVETIMSQELNKSESDSQIARYAQLTENCTHRIAELTELINRVREEKQRLLEVTLSSVSDNGRQSTEYLDLPEGKSRTTNEGESSQASSSDETVAAPRKSTSSFDLVRQIPKLSALEKNRPIAASQDSGIAESRPITAQENRQDLEPISQTSTESHSNIHAQRKMRPPPSLRRFSPQFQEDELVHELSTILEVDTPANSRINTAVSQKSEDPVAAATSTTVRVETPPQNAIMFPTFEEYVNRLNLDITQLDAEQSSQLHAEFSLFLEDMQRSHTKESRESPPQYNEFPSITGYMNQTKYSPVDQTQTMEESLAQLRLNGLKPKSFPAVREYVQRNGKDNATTSDDQQLLLDTESLENITESESASLDIEKELKERKIMKNSFRYTKTKQIFSSTAHHDGGEFYQEILAGESGIEKLSTSGNTTAILETDLKRMVRQWSKDGKKNSQQPQYQSLSSTTTSTTYQTKPDKLAKSTSLAETSNENGRPLNLRDFLTRELLKHANFSTSTSTSSSDDSLRSQFLYSLIGSLTPQTNAATSKSGQHTLDRQKTSTPVPIQSSQTHSTPTSGGGRHPSQTSSSQLFSGESRLSSVHGYDRTMADGGIQGDQSSE